MAKATAWSYSRYETWARCPLQFKFKFVDKLKEAGSPAMDRGSVIHLSAAHFCTGQADAIDPAFMQHKQILKLAEEIRAHPSEDKDIEQQWGYTATFAPTGWFGGDTWFRSILDAGVVYEDMHYEAVDWKTGKRYGSNDDQVETQALAVMKRNPMVVHVTTRLAYVDSGDQVFAEFPATHMEKIAAKWQKKVTPMFADEIYAPRPNDKCRFCTWRRSGDSPKCAFG
jgi:hypothetical protein